MWNCSMFFCLFMTMPKKKKHVFFCIFVMFSNCAFVSEVLFSESIDTYVCLDMFEYKMYSFLLLQIYRCVFARENSAKRNLSYTLTRMSSH